MVHVTVKDVFVCSLTAVHRVARGFFVRYAIMYGSQRTDALDAELRQGTSGLEAKRKEVKLLEGQNASSKLEAAALDAAIVKLNAEVRYSMIHT